MNSRSLFVPEVVQSNRSNRFERFPTRVDNLKLEGASLHAHHTIEHPGAVVIVPLVRPGVVIMVRQYRHSIGQWLLEFPAGTMEKTGEKLEDPLLCAKRELAEEVEMSAASWSHIVNLAPAPGFCSEVQYCYLAEDLQPCTDFEKDADEITETVELKIAELFEVMKKEGLVDAKSLALLALLQG